MTDVEYKVLTRAKNQFESGNPKGAVQTLEDYLLEDPHNIKVRLYLANVAYRIGDRQFGDLQMDILYDLDPENVDVLKARATILSADKKKVVEAEECFQKLIIVEPSAEVYNEYARFLRIQKTDFQASAEWFEKAIAAAPDKKEYHQNYAAVLLMDLKDYVKARREMEIVLEMDPNNVSVRKNYDLLIKKKFNPDGTLKKKRFGFGK